jgi:branched-chain amino acid transport system permease protein
VLVTGVGVFILLALGLNVLLGLAGILDLGYAVNFGVGAYMAAMLTNKWSGLGAVVPQPLDFIVVLLVSVLFAAIFGAVKGRLTLRLRSDYLAVVTLALGLLARQVIINMNDFTGGVGGIAALPPPTIFSLTIKDAAMQYYFVFGLVIIVALASRQMIVSRVGRAWMASSEDETAAEASGVNVANQKMLALTVSSAIAGAAGALYAAVFAYVAPEIVDFHISAMMLAMVILGGAGDVTGSILGAAIIAGYDRLIIPRLGDVLAFLQLGNISVGYAPDVRGASYLSFGLALYLTVLLRARKK